MLNLGILRIRGLLFWRVGAILQKVAFIQVFGSHVRKLHAGNTLSKSFVWIAFELCPKVGDGLK